ncbi:hypothetical protein J5N97_021324 [Dioscorea zingiberensis]|uniref:Uncharacterized protein n=1 Tax=Dioscorea zingiberensis TaxID=325984 RepID=A0A9D5HEI6_9LILI|nr:hypothetical protein J5N97_021324 [Dioscorea zingiberensis]
MEGDGVGGAGGEEFGHPVEEAVAVAVTEELGEVANDGERERTSVASSPETEVEMKGSASAREQRAELHGAAAPAAYSQGINGWRSIAATGEKTSNFSNLPCLQVGDLLAILNLEFVCCHYEAFADQWIGNVEENSHYKSKLITSQFEAMHPPTSDLGSVRQPAVSLMTETIGGNAIEQNICDTHPACPNASASEDFFGGIKRILPSEVDEGGVENGQGDGVLSETQPMNITVEGQGTFEANNPEGPGQKNDQLPEKDDISTWKIAGARRGRGRGRGPPNHGRKIVEPGRISGQPVANSGDRHVESLVTGRPTRGGRGGFHKGLKIQSRDSFHQVFQGESMEKEWPPLVNHTANTIERSEDPISNMAAGSQQLALVQKKGTDLGKQQPKNQERFSGGMVRPSIELLTSFDTDQRLRNKGKGIESYPKKHDQLVDRIMLAIEDKKQEAGSDQLMEEAPDELENPQDIYDDDMPLAQVQKEAKMEALARRDKSKEGSCSKKGRLEGPEIAAQANIN